MAPTTRPDHKINLEGLPQLSMGTTRSANGSATNSPIEPAGSGFRYPLGNGLGSAGSQLGSGRAGAGSPSKEYGSRLFPKRYVNCKARSNTQVTNQSPAHAKSKLKKAFRHLYGVHRPPAADTPRLCARSSPNRLAATAFPTSMRPLRRLGLRLRVKALRTRADAHAQARSLHASLR
jgi:hypothetical protein